MRVTFVEWPEGLTVPSTEWDKLKLGIQAEQTDLLVTNELPFGPWIAEDATFSRKSALLSISAHDQGLEGLRELALPAVISSRPVWDGERLANEAFVLEGNWIRALHRKQYFPDEPGWFEREWYSGDGSGFYVAEILGIKIGVLLCTEAMFNEHARHYGRDEAALIVLPRATGIDITQWHTAAAMAGLVSGAYVVSSNRVGLSKLGTRFGGCGFAYEPPGRLVSVTGSDTPIRTIELDLGVPRQARGQYPCYVPEL
jgi:N-carbamoylputrescine amidase